MIIYDDNISSNNRPIKTLASCASPIFFYVGLLHVAHTYINVDSSHKD